MSEVREEQQEKSQNQNYSAAIRQLLHLLRSFCLTVPEQLLAWFLSSFFFSLLHTHTHPLLMSANYYSGTPCTLASIYYSATYKYTYSQPGRYTQTYYLTLPQLHSARRRGRRRNGKIMRAFDSFETFHEPILNPEARARIGTLKNLFS